MNQTRREHLRSLAVVLAASPFLALPPEKRCSCDIPLWSFEEWQDRRAKKSNYDTVTMTFYGDGHGGGDPAEVSDPVLEALEQVSQRLTFSIDQDILKHYAKATCPIHGEARFGGPNPDPDPKELGIAYDKWFASRQLS